MRDHEGSRSGDERRRRLGSARLYLVVEAEPAGRPAKGLLEAALAGGVDIVQLREKHAPDEAVLRAGLDFRQVCRRHGALLVVNDRPDLALACGADGVHVGQEDEPVERVRDLVGPDLLIGVSTHSPPDIDTAAGSSADYLGVGPVHPTATKPGTPAVGLDLVRYATARAGKPFFAIGGIDAANAHEAVEAGAGRLAVVRAIRDAPDPQVAAAALCAAIDRREALAAP